MFGYSCKCINDCCPIGEQKNLGTASEGNMNRAQCDLYIDMDRTSVKDLSQYYYLETVVAHRNDDAPRFVELIINLPVEIEFSSFNGSVQSPSGSSKLDCKQCGHVIKCTPQNEFLNSGEEIKFSAKIGKPRFNNIKATIGVTALSHFPADPNPENNTFYWKE